MTARLTSKFLVSALIRRVEGEGGHAMVIKRGDEGAGAILLLCAARGIPQKLIERIFDPSKGYVWAACGPEDPTDNEALSGYLERRRARDPDIWILELDIVDAERFAAETIGAG